MIVPLAVLKRALGVTGTAEDALLTDLEALAVALASLRGQVDVLAVVCHDMAEPPACVKAVADLWVCEPDTRGSAAKLHWARSWDGYYLACDDDFMYPTDYAATMRRWVDAHARRALVVGHGRVLREDAKTFLQAEWFAAPRQANVGGWVNYPGCCALAFHTDLRVPDRVEGKSMEEPQLARWAQWTQTPIWLVPHAADWLQYLLPESAPTIWAEEKGNGFAARNAVIAQQGRWAVHTPEAAHA